MDCSVSHKIGAARSNVHEFEEPNGSTLATRLICYLALLITSSGIAASANAANEPWDVQSDSYEILLDQKQVTYLGNVVAEQGVFTIKADRLRAFFNDNNEVIRMEAYGTKAAQAELEDRGQAPVTRLHGDALHYNLNNSRVTARGNTLLVRGQDTLNAHELVYNLNEERVVANRNDQERVRVVLFPQGTKPQ